MGDRILIAGTGSGSGKTSLTCGLIKIMHDKNLNVLSFKSGPDFIDPLFHKTLLGVNSYNLDLFISGKNNVKQLLNNKSEQADLSIIEGVMGFYDGILGTDFSGSSYDISRITGTPVILVVNCKGKSASVVAEIKGYLELAPNLIKGVVLNHVSEKSFAYYKTIISTYLDIQVLGYIPYLKELALEERKLGLFFSEPHKIRNKIYKLATVLEKTIDTDTILKIAKEALPLKSGSYTINNKYDLRIAVAYDEAFCFHYDYNWELIEKLGGELIWFSPLKDKKLPEDIDGIIIGGGYVESYVKMLSKNTSILLDIKEKLNKNIPAIVEGSGNILLCEKFIDEAEIAWVFSGVIPLEIKKTSSLQNFGYHYLKANIDNLICGKDQVVPVHEFHHYSLNDQGNGFRAFKPATSHIKRQAGFSSSSLYAGMPYLNFCGNEFIAENFLTKCEQYKLGKNI